MLKLLLAVTVGGASLCGAAADPRVKVDNDAVRILSVVDKPHNKSAMHKHDSNRVMVYLDSGDLTLTYDDGRKEEQHWKAGQVAWAVGGPLHTSENVGSEPIRIVEVELKKAAPAKGSLVRNAKLDPVKIDPEHNVLLLENDQVRVFKSSREPGGVEKMHEHPGAGRVAVLLTDLDAMVTPEKGGATPWKASAGEVFWSGPGVHSAKNVSAKRSEMVIVEVK